MICTIKVTLLLADESESFWNKCIEIAHFLQHQDKHGKHVF